MREIELKQIAEELNISSTTVSRALSGNGRISASTKERIQKYLKDNDYTIKYKSVEYTDRRTKNICITLPGEDNFAEMPYFQATLLSVIDYYATRDYNVIPIKTSADDISELKKIIKHHKVDGVILTRTIKNGIDIEYLKAHNVPFIVIGSCEDDSVYQVDVDQENGCKELTSLLLKMGYRRLALFCADMTHIVTQNRYNGFFKAHIENDISVDTRYIFDEAGYSHRAAQALDDCLKNQIECIVCMDDNICVNVLNRLKVENVVVPRDIKVASFYDSSVLEMHYPPITALEFNTRDLGWTAAKNLYELLHGNEIPHRQLLGYQLILRDSTKRTDESERGE
jgi:DNA-binding LacI/PurR family transcriptional regulator